MGIQEASGTNRHLQDFSDQRDPGSSGILDTHCYQMVSNVPRGIPEGARKR